MHFALSRPSPGSPSQGCVRRIGAAVGVALAVVALGACGSSPVSTVGELDFANPLRIPPLAEPDRDGNRVTFDLEFQAGTTRFLDGPATDTWGLNGSYLAPTLRARLGDQVTVHVTNSVDETTTLHWHGMHLPSSEDGGPHQMIEPGATWSPSWTINQPAATLWFHPHLHERTAEHVYRGAAGMFILDDPAAAALDLPDTYGVDDIPVIVQDRSFGRDNQFTRREPANTGILGDEILINGTHNPHLDVTTELVRLRVLNASNGRLYNLRFDDHRPYHLIATDSGLLPAPVEMTDLRMAPGERAELVVAMRPGERAVLQSVEPDLGTSSGGRGNGSHDSFDLLQLRAADHLESSATLPNQLVPIDELHPNEVVATRSFELGNDTINGNKMDMERVDLVVENGAVEVWEITNDHGRPHSFHPHLIHFLVLDVDGHPPPPHLSGWKDTIYVPPGETIRVIARFDGYPDPTVPYMFHCHILQHEDDGMMGQFVVIEPGTTPPDRIDIGEDHDDGH